MTDHEFIPAQYNDRELKQLAAQLNQYAIKAYADFLKNTVVTEKHLEDKQLFIRNLIACTSKYLVDTHEQK